MLSLKWGTVWSSGFQIRPRPEGLLKLCLEKRTIMNLLKKFLASEDGPTAVEYAVMLALIVVASITTITALGAKVNSSFDATTTKLP